MAKNYDITRVEVYKNYIFLLSLVEYSLGIAAMFSTHSIERYNGSLRLADVKTYFQKAHNKQIRAMIKKEELLEPEEYKIKTVQSINPMR